MSQCQAWLAALLAHAAVGFLAPECAAQQKEPTSRAVQEQGNSRDRLSEMTRRTGTIWLNGQPCQAMSAAERDDYTSVRNATLTCANALYARVITRLDGRGDLALTSSIGAIGGVAAGGVQTVNTLSAIGVLPIFYEAFQSGRMTSIEFYAAHGLNWLLQQSNDLDAAFEGLHTARIDLDAARARARSAASVVNEMLDCLNTEIAGLRRTAKCSEYAAATAAARTETKAQLELLLVQYQRADYEASQVDSDASAALRRQDSMADWMGGRFDRLRLIAANQQRISRVGPEEAFRELVAAPFAIVANALTGGSKLEANLYSTQRSLELQLETLRRPLGVQATTRQIANIDFNRARVGNFLRATEAANQHTDMQAMIEAARRTNAAINHLHAVDDRQVEGPPPVSG